MGNLGYGCCLTDKQADCNMNCIKRTNQPQNTQKRQPLSPKLNNDADTILSCQIPKSSLSKDNMKGNFEFQGQQSFESFSFSYDNTLIIRKQENQDEDKENQQTKLSQVQEIERQAATKINDLYEQITSFDLTDFELVLGEDKQKLKVYFRSYLTPEKNNILVVQARFIVPCDPQAYIKYDHNIEQQRRIDSKIEEYQKLDTFTDQLSIYYQSVKKPQVYIPREYIFLDYIQQFSNQKNIWCNIKFSVNHETIKPNSEKIRGNIIKSGYIAQQIKYLPKSFDLVKDVSPDYTLVTYYSEIDHKIKHPIQQIKNTTLADMKSYVEKSYNALNSAYSERFANKLILK